MLIDSHCHIDQFPEPETLIQECQQIPMRVVAVTNLPSHYEIALSHLEGQSHILPALGMHPLCAKQGIRELSDFRRLADSAICIGEIGLDFSRAGIATKSIQTRVFEEVLRTLHGRQRFISIHSRGAEEAVLEALSRHQIECAVFHWFTGPTTLLKDIFKAGHLVSINASAISTQKGYALISKAPKDSVLVESDGPFAKVHGKPAHPRTVALAYEALAQEWGLPFDVAVNIVNSNFDRTLHLLPQ